MILRRVRTALNGLVGMIADDFRDLRAYVQWYRNKFYEAKNPFLYHYNHTIVKKVEALKFHLYLIDLEDNLTESNRNMLLEILTEAKTFNLTLNKMSNEERNDYYPNYHGDLWTRSYSGCDNNMTVMVNLIDKGIQQLSNFNYTKQATTAVKTNLNSLLKVIPDVTTCMYLFLATSADILDTIDTVTSEINEMRTIKLNGLVVDLKPALAEEIQYLKDNKTNLKDMMKNYSNNLYDKHKLARDLNDTLLTSLNLLLDSIEKKMNVEGRPSYLRSDATQ